MSIHSGGGEEHTCWFFSWFARSNIATVRAARDCRHVGMDGAADCLSVAIAIAIAIPPSERHLFAGFITGILQLAIITIYSEKEFFFLPLS